MIRTYHRTIDGQQVGENDAFDERGRIRDGFTIRTPVMLMDGVPTNHAPLRTSTAVTDAYDARLQDAWKNIAPAASDAPVREATVAGISDAREAAYLKYDTEVQNAWR